MASLEMPQARDVGWALKETASSFFAIHKRENGQFCVLLNHALLRGCRAEMLRWWFQNFPNLRVTLPDTPGYEGVSVPAYLLWHPIDHHSATLSGALGPKGETRVGASIQIREAMQYDRFGWRYPVDAKLKIFYVGADGWAMGRTIPLFGPVMMLRIHFQDVIEAGQHLGVHYHYEVVIGVSGGNYFSRKINKKVSAKFGPEFFEAWRRHNVVEVGVFENFLPALYAQRSEPTSLAYRREMDPAPTSPAPQTGVSQALFDARLAAYQAASDPYQVQGFDRPSFL